MGQIRSGVRVSAGFQIIVYYRKQWGYDIGGFVDVLREWTALNDEDGCLC